MFKKPLAFFKKFFHIEQRTTHVKEEHQSISVKEQDRNIAQESMQKFLQRKQGVKDKSMSLKIKRWRAKNRLALLSQREQRT